MTCRRPALGRTILLGCCCLALGLAGCGGSGKTMSVGTAVSLSREGNSGDATARAFKYKTAIVSVTQAGPSDLKGIDLIGTAPKDSVAFYVSQRVTGVQSDYRGWLPETPDVFSGSKEATPLTSGTDLRKCVEHKPPASFGPGASFSTCDVYLLPPGKKVTKLTLAATGPGQSDISFKPS